MASDPPFRPRCLNGEQSLGHSTKGYIMPCCYVDSWYHNIPEHREQTGLNKLSKESLKISNNKHLVDITTSKEWIEFYTMLQDDSQEKPKLCLKICKSRNKGPSNSGSAYGKSYNYRWSEDRQTQVQNIAVTIQDNEK